MSGRLPDAVRKLLELPAGERKIGAFRLMRPLGQGGFAPVWLADEVAGSAVLRQAAVKLFALERGGEARQAIIDEAARLCRLEHPNIVRFYALPIDEPRAVVGLAMEYVAGKPLAQVLLERRELPVREALDIGIAIASALSAVHSAGLVHRDVHTSNVMVTESIVGSPSAYKLIDFGIAAAGARGLPGSAPRGGRSAEELVVSRLEGLGKRGYVDPVCWREEAAATSSSDLYALGVVLFVSLAGRLPAAGPEGLDDDVLAGTKSAPPLASLVQDVPPPLAELVDALLSPERPMRPRSAEAVVIELERQRAALAGRKRSLPTESEGPFRGLARFEREHRDVFFGRRVEAASALEVLRTRGLLALVGPSGSGKSSLARAGILPALEDGALGGARSWEQVVVSPGMDPRQALLTALFHVEIDPQSTPEEAASKLEAWVAEGWRGLVILVDQLEELSTLEGEIDSLAESRAFTKDFLARLGNAPRPGLRVIVTARQDLLDKILEHRPLGRALMRGTVLVSPLREAAWGEVIDAGLESYGYGFEDVDLRSDLLHSLKDTADAMPLVEFALTKLWELRDTQQKTITRASWVELGGIAGALDAHATAVARSVEEERLASEADIKRVMLSLVTPAGARTSRTLKELTDDGRSAAAVAVVARFEEARLLVREGSRGARAHDRLTLAHEALLTHWGKLRAWVAEEREERLLREDLGQAAALWARTGDAELLWRRRRLLLTQEILRKRGVRLEGDEGRFFRASLWAMRRVRIALLALGAVVVLTTLGGLRGYAYMLELRAEKAQAEAHAMRERAENAEAQLQMSEALKQMRVAEEKAQEVLLAYEQIKEAVVAGQQTSPVRAFTGAPEPALAPGAIDQIEDYLLNQQRMNEPVPELLANVLPEIAVAPVEGRDGANDAPPEPASRPPSPTVRASNEVLTSLPPGHAFAALRGAQGRVASCTSGGGPRGKGRVVLVFAPEGRVSSVVLERPFAGTSVGRCVEAAFQQADVQPFRGKPITVFWSFMVP